jgi:hypothetical protein
MRLKIPGRTEQEPERLSCSVTGTVPESSRGNCKVPSLLSCEQGKVTRVTMSVIIKFIRSGSFHAGDFLSLELDKITKLQVNRLRNTCELLAYTPENPQPNTPFVIARRDTEYKLQDILKELQELKQENKDIIYEITDAEVRLIKKI